MTEQRLDLIEVGDETFYLQPSPELSREDKRFSYAPSGYSTDLNRESHCSWKLEKGRLLLEKILDGNFIALKSDITADWFTEHAALLERPSSTISSDKSVLFFEGKATIVRGLENSESLSHKLNLKEIAEMLDESEATIKQGLIDLKFIKSNS